MNEYTEFKGMSKDEFREAALDYLEKWVVFLARCGDWEGAMEYMGDFVAELHQ